jgi:hypothetical protein
MTSQEFLFPLRQMLQLCGISSRRVWSPFETERTEYWRNEWLHGGDLFQWLCYICAVRDRLRSEWTSQLNIFLICVNFILLHIYIYIYIYIYTYISWRRLDTLSFWVTLGKVRQSCTCTYLINRARIFWKCICAYANAYFEGFCRYCIF